MILPEFSQFLSGYVNTMKAHGGGDGPEAVTAALADAFNLPWRPNATKICPLAARVGDKYRGTLLGRMDGRKNGKCYCIEMDYLILPPFMEPPCINGERERERQQPDSTDYFYH